MVTIYNRTEPARIDKYLAELSIPELYSRSLIEALIADGNVTVNGNTVKKSYLLKENDLIDIDIPPPVNTKAEAEDIPLDVVFEDEYFAVINKPAGIIVHPTPGTCSGTIVNAALNYFGDNLADFDANRPGIVHRLDKNTSGLLIIAKDNKTLYLLNKMFAERRIKKQYKAITVGIPAQKEGTISAKIGRSNKDRTKMVIRDSGRFALTRYCIEETYSFFSLLNIHLETGRTHQIRVHLNYINCPVLGDDVYGTNRLKNLIPLNIYKKVHYYIERQLKRQALHAYKLEFVHPITDEELLIEVPLADDMQKCLNWLDSFLIREENR